MPSWSGLFLSFSAPLTFSWPLKGATKAVPSPLATMVLKVCGLHGRERERVGHTVNVYYTKVGFRVEAAAPAQKIDRL